MSLIVSIYVDLIKTWNILSQNCAKPPPIWMRLLGTVLWSVQKDENISYVHIIKTLTLT